MSRFIITGDRAAGKTTFCRNLSLEAVGISMTVTGILTETERDVALTAVDLLSGEKRTLAQVRDMSTKETPGGDDSVLETGRWIFNPETMVWGNRILLISPPSDLFILDEAGILEFQKEQGWTEGIARMDRHPDRCSLVVVRPELVGAALRRWPDAEVLPVSRPDSGENRSLIRKILSSF